MNTIVGAGSRLTASLSTSERNVPSVVVTTGILTDAPTPPTGRSRSMSEPIPFTSRESEFSEETDGLEFGSLRMSDMGDLLNYVGETFAEEFGDTQPRSDGGRTDHQNALDTHAIIGGEREPTEDTFEEAGIDQIVSPPELTDKKIPLQDEAGPRLPRNPFSPTRYDSSEWTGGFVERDESKQTLTSTLFLEDLDHQPRGVDSLRFVALHHREPSEAPAQTTIGGLKSILSTIADKLRTVASKFAQLFESKAQTLDRKVAEFGKQIEAYQNGGTVVPTFKGPAQALDRIDQMIAGGPSKVDVRGSQALSVFSGNFEGQVNNNGGRRSEKLAELSNHITTMLADLKKDAANKDRNPAQLTEREFVLVGIKTMIGSATIADLQAIHIESLEELCGCFGSGNQGEKADFVRELIGQLATFPSLTDPVAVASHRNELLNTADATRVTPKPKEGDQPRAPETRLNYKRLGLEDVLRGSPEEISVTLTKLLDVLAQDSESPEVNQLALTQVAFRQNAFVGIMLKTDASHLRGVNLEAAQKMVGFFLDRGQPEKAQAMSELVDLIKASRTPEGSRLLFMDIAKDGLAKVTNLDTFLRQTSEVTAACIKKMVDSTDAIAYAGDIRKVLERFAGNDSMKRLQEQLKGPFREEDERAQGLKKGDPEPVGSFIDKRITPELGVLLTNAATELLNEIIKVPVPVGLRSLLGELTDVLQDRDTDSSGFVNKLYCDQIFLKLINAQFGGNSPIEKPALMLGNFLQVVANGVAVKTSWAPNAKTAYTDAYPALRAKLEDYFVQNGMPESARGA